MQEKEKSSISVQRSLAHKLGQLADKLFIKHRHLLTSPGKFSAFIVSIEDCKY